MGNNSFMVTPNRDMTAICATHNLPVDTLSILSLTLTFCRCACFDISVFFLSRIITQFNADGILTVVCK